MKKQNSILLFETISTIFVIILGTLLHFTYNWSNNNPIISIFSSVNESTWEHLKLLFFPMLLTTIIGHKLYKESIPNYIYIKTKGTIFSLIFLTTFFYTYSGIIGENIALINILSFPLTVIINQYYIYNEIKKNKKNKNKLAIIILITFTISFITFTFFPPNIGIFKNPI